MEHSIEHLFHINAPIGKVYDAINKVENIRQWYTTNIEENSDHTKTFRWGEMFLKIQFDEIENEKIIWKFLESSMPIESLLMSYELSENEGKTRVRFTYGNFEEKSDFFANQNFSSAKYLESLRQFCQTGIGEAFGSENYRS